MKRTGHALALACLLLLSRGEAAAEWTADIVDTESSPTRFVAVDKKAQSFALLSRQSPLKLVSAIPCATGQELGDKFKEGDLKTPEGVYFITRRKSAGLNYELYGDLAFPLNFPNPADVLRRKSGHGIWIHGRGHAIIPFETQGCVALSTPDIHRVDPELAEGMPVVIADEVRLGGGDAARLRDEAREAVAATEAWAKAWQDRSPAFFDFHDPEKFSITEGVPFASFRSHKERLFKSLPWIQVTLSDIRALAGPDYWVTYFVQVYRSPTLVSQGVKRLYWQRGSNGRLRIVGMEYEEMPVTLADKGALKSRKASPGEIETDTRRPDSPSEEEVQVRQLVNAQQAAMEKVAQKAFHSLNLKRQPTPEDQAILEVAQTGPADRGVSPFATDAMTQAPPPPAKPVPDPIAAPVAPPPAPAKAPEPAVAAANPPAASPAVTPALPEKPQAAPAAVAAAPAPQPLVVANANPPAATPAQSEKPAPPVPSEKPVAAPSAVPAATPTAAPVKAATATPDQTATVAAMLESWRAAWEKGRIDDYMAFYADDARQGDLRGKAAIRRQKEGVWRGHEPGRVGIEIVSVTQAGDGFVAVCAEDYQGRSGGRQSKGFKIMTLAPSGKKLCIIRERWSRFRPDDGQIQAAVAGVPAAASGATASAAVAPEAKASAAPAPEARQQATSARADRTAEVAAMIEAWRGAWERGKAGEYAGFYAENAVQGPGRGRDAIRDQKAALWKDKAPRRVALSEIKIKPRKDGFVVTCVQDYESRDGGSDRGLKTLYLAPSGQGFAIVEEKWSRL